MHKSGAVEEPASDDVGFVWAVVGFRIAGYAFGVRADKGVCVWVCIAWPGCRGLERVVT